MEQSDQQPSVKAGASPLNGVVPPFEHRIKPGEIRNPEGRKTAGAYLREWVNVMAEYTEKDLRKVARDTESPVAKRAAAERLLRTIEAGDLADMQEAVDGTATLKELRETGVNTEIVKKMKVKVRTLEDGSTEIERELELHDRAGQDFDRVFDRTEGKPKQTSEIITNMPISVQIVTPLSRIDREED